MAFSDALDRIATDFLRRHEVAAATRLEITAPDVWSLEMRGDLPGLPGLHVRPLRAGDEPAMHDFASRLGENSRDLFAPYPWADPAALPAAFGQAIANAVTHVDAAYLIQLAGDRTIGHFFLWKAGGNPHSRAHGVQVPELGVAIADDFQGQGLGGLAVRILQAVARELGADAIELTTALTNAAGWNTYRRCGFVYTGLIDTPLDVDVTAAEAGVVQATRYRRERQLVDLVDETARAPVLAYLALKRGESQR